MPSRQLEVRTLRFRRWGVILAGGDGKRLLPLTRKITGDDRPKQFCALTGGETLLDQTRRRVARMVPEHQTLLVLTRTHQNFYAGQVAGIPASCLLIQPYNHGTAPAIAYSLTRLYEMDPDGVVAFFPSDHHFGDDDAFAAHIELAFAQAEQDHDRVILLGITPEAPEEAYGWIEPGAALTGAASGCVFQVRRFWEKPSRRIASQLMRRGCLWNSFVMVGRVSAFLNLVRQTLPSLLKSLESMRAAAVPGEEHEALRNLYSSIPATNFSDDVLSASPAALAVLRADALGWSDLGEPKRVFSVVRLKEAAGSLENGWFGAGLGIPA
jgi:mannose-1-phosphate guanylyltransferase